MLTDLKKVLNLNTEFSRNVLTLVTGTTISQIIPIAISPILTRIYSPEDFGVLALFLSVSLLLGAIASARYEQAIILPEKDEDALNLIILSLLFLIITVFLILTVVVFFHHQIVALLNNNAISIWLYFVPLMILLLGTFNILNVYTTRLKRYSIIAKANIYKSVTLATVQVFWGLLKAGASGLISGQIFSVFTATIILIRKSINLKTITNTVSLANLKLLAKRYVRFPKYSLWAVMSSALTQNVMNIAVSSIYSISILGFYSFATKILYVPANIFGVSIGQVFYQQAVREKRKSGKSSTTFRAVVSRLTFLSIMIFGTLYFVMEDIFAIFFGEPWRIAGEYAKALVPLVMMKFIVSPLSTINSIFDKQITTLIWQIGFLIITISLLFIAIFLNVEFSVLVIQYSRIISFYYLLLLPVLYNHAMGRNWYGSYK